MDRPFHGFVKILCNFILFLLGEQPFSSCIIVAATARLQLCAGKWAGRWPASDGTPLALESWDLLLNTGAQLTSPLPYTGNLRIEVTI